MLVVVLILVSIALCVTLGILLFGPQRGSTAPSAQQRAELENRAKSALETELEKRRKELDEQRAQTAELKDQLKQAKRKLFEHKEQEKNGQGIARAREEIERTASIQLEVVRSELSAALAEVEKLKAEAQERPKRSTSPPPVETVPQAALPAAPPARRFRELSDADRERIQRMEQQSAKDRTRALDLEREAKRLRGRLETQHRIYVVTKGELDLLKDKFKALEKRLNRTLLERDLLRRAIKDLERKSGILAERTELTAEEIADSDRKVEEKTIAEAGPQLGSEKPDPEAEKSIPPQQGADDAATDAVDHSHSEAGGGTV